MTLAEDLGHFLSEYVDDNAPLNERFYVLAAEAAIQKFGLVALPFVQVGPIEVYEEGHEPWDIEFNEGQANHWCEEHQRAEVVID